ncbi:hypothetical protein C8A05DRAFT_47279 [Staphylotrichum tortipilum]|uniref:Major facilitator superfamily (MFS) profile domain-containing protein n=1 Tax=Staphylotrichum tortipilum TaxID=2831512 RepID=A0AAN6MEC1_9PEZI|nr:hypothetical protein C8A05DRAFT_47279 [Staphylotrichum longicolle]
MMGVREKPSRRSQRTLYRLRPPPVNPLPAEPHRTSWSHNRDPDFFWPLKFLPFEPEINEARILTFGYNANFRPGSGRTKMSVLDFAKDLLYDLKYSQDESVPELEDLRMGERPIIFIVHSMGGLIVKEAYMQGQNDPAYDSIIKAISAIIFLSTPHRGTNLAETLNRILQVSFATSPTQFISELSAGSQTLQKLNEQFRHIAPKLDIVSFYETRPTPLAVFKKSQILVLEKDSSVLGYPGEISKPLDADHHGVCKYASPADPRYVTVRNVLKTLVGKVGLNGAEPDPVKPAGSSFAEYLSLSEPPDADYNFFRDRWTPGTCSWILSHGTFRGWMDGHGRKPRVLWVHGNAASGKSILSSFLINHLAELGVPSHYFFIRFMSQEKRGTSMLLRSLACQLASSTPEYAQKVQQLQAAGTELKAADYRGLWQSLFKQALFQLELLDKPIYVVIDGIDEADRPSQIIKLLGDLRLTTLPIRILLVSRNTHEISSGFQKLAKQVDMETIRIEGNPIDFRAYVHHEMDLGGDADYQEQVATQLLARAKGNFLWIHLAVQRINSCHTRPDVENALTELPSGMEALYDRMALSVETASHTSNQKLGQAILGWTACAQRLLTVEELGDALGSEAGVLEIHRTITDLCGGFVAVDQEGRASMIHETAREYLTRGSEKGRSLVIGVKPTNDMLLSRCIARLTDPALRSQINRGRPPPLLGYAATAWPHHLGLSSALTNPRILDLVANFLKGPHVLTWIYVVANLRELRALLRRRRNDDESVSSRQATIVIEGWATDLVKVVGKFGGNLRSDPGSIYKLIPPFCPEDSMIYRQFGRKESRTLQVSGFTSSAWDDCLARFSLTPGAVAASVITAGGRIALLSITRNTSQIIIYSSSTFEEQRRITHPERVLSIQANKLGDVIVSYGYTTTRVWDNPRKRPRPHTIIFAEKQKMILVCGEDRCIRSCPLDGDVTDLHDTIVNFPICSSFSPDGSMVAFGYRNHPLTCYVRLNEKVFRVAWHPLTGEVFGLTQEETSDTVQAGGDTLAVNQDGSLVATGDGVGTIKLSSQDPVMCLRFSADSRRLYDIRGSHGNVWEPNTLVRLADCPDHNSDTNSETESLAKASLLSEHHFARVDSVISLAGQSFGPLYCYVGRGKVFEHVIWSGDGRLVALADLSGKLAIKRVTRSGEHRDTWEGGNLFVATPVNSALKLGPQGTLKVKWACHPTNSDALIGWEDLSQREEHTYFPPRLGRSSTISRDTETLGRLITNVDSPEALLEISSVGPSGQHESHYLLFDISNLHLGGEPGSPKMMPYKVIAPDIAAKIREPLAILSRRRLIFLGVDRWICTWKLPSLAVEGPKSQGRRDSQVGESTAIEQHYFLPGDWVTGSDTRLCAVTPDGTLLCPRNGDVVTIHPCPRVEPYSIFPLSTRTYLTYLLGLTITLSTLTATIYFPLIPLLSTTFSVPLQKINLTVTAYAVAQALSPALFASLADHHGRRPVLLALVALYTLASLGLALNSRAKNYGVLLGLRVVQSVGGSPTPAIAYGVVADLVEAGERGGMLGVLLGVCNAVSAVGPVIGGVVALKTEGVEGVFWGLMGLAGAVGVAVGFTMPETGRPVVGNGGWEVRGVWKTWRSWFGGRRTVKGAVEEKGMVRSGGRENEPRRPWRLGDAVASFRIILHKDAFVVLWMVASSYSVYYTFQVAIPVIFDEVYGYNELEIGLVFLPGLAGMTIGGMIAGKLADHNYCVTARKHGFEDKTKGEQDLSVFPIEEARYRQCLAFVFAELVLVAGYGWAVRFRVHPAVPIVLQFFACAVSTLLSHTSSALLVDIFPDASSSAYASGQLMRCGLSAASAAVLQPLIDAVDRGWYFTMFSLLVNLTCAASVVVSQRKGMLWRQQRLAKHH